MVAIGAVLATKGRIGTAVQMAVCGRLTNPFEDIVSLVRKVIYITSTINNTIELDSFVREL